MGGRGGRSGASCRPPRARAHSAELPREFAIWMENLPRTWLQIPCSFAEELATDGLAGLWLQPDGCCSRSSWVDVEITRSGYAYLTRGWQSFARARGLKGRHTLLFKFDSATTLFMKAFGEDGRRLGCCPEGDSDHGQDNDILGCELALGRGASRSSCPPSDDGSSGDDYAKLCRLSIKAEADFD